MQKYCFFKTFDEAKASQQYDHNYQKALAFSEITGIEIDTIRSENLHIAKDGGFPIDSYIESNNISIENMKQLEIAKSYWNWTTSWAQIYKLGNEFCYIMDSPDIPYNDVREIDFEYLVELDDNGNIKEIIDEY